MHYCSRRCFRAPRGYYSFRASDGATSKRSFASLHCVSLYSFLYSAMGPLRRPMETRVHHEHGLRIADPVHILRFNYSPVERTLPALWKVIAGRMKSRLGSSLFVQPPPGFALRAITRTFSLPAGVALTVLSEAARLYSRVIPRCIHSENCYSFPRTFAGKTTRTCCKCGHRREYDMTTMRFVTGRFVSTS